MAERGATLNAKERLVCFGIYPMSIGDQNQCTTTANHGCISRGKECDFPASTKTVASTLPASLKRLACWRQAEMCPASHKFVTYRVQPACEA
jgi:hypothetical protein